MLINIEAKRPVLGNKEGGISGPAIRPIALLCISKIYEAVEVPVLGGGGVIEGRDAIALIEAGASAVGIGVYYRGITVFKEVCKEMSTWMMENGYSRVKDLVGVAHGRDSNIK